MPEPDIFDQLIEGIEAAPTSLKAAVGVIGVVGAAAVAIKHREAKEAVAATRRAMEYAALQESAANSAQQYARDKHVEASHHQQRAETAESRSRKLAKELAHTANVQIATLKRIEPPQLLFGGCHMAATDGDCIFINLDWLLCELVDEAVFGGDIWGRVVGVVAHEWYHYLDPSRGQRVFHEEELAADRHAGKVLAELKEKPDCFALLLKTFPESSTHPPGELRAEQMLSEYKKKQG